MQGTRGAWRRGRCHRAFLAGIVTVCLMDSPSVNTSNLFHSQNTSVWIIKYMVTHFRDHIKELYF